jgi:hypothetical protein
MTAAAIGCMSSTVIARHLSGTNCYLAPFRRRAPLPDDMPVFGPGLILGSRHLLSTSDHGRGLGPGGISRFSASGARKKPNVSPIFREPEKRFHQNADSEVTAHRTSKKHKFFQAQARTVEVRTLTKPAIIAADLHLSIFKINRLLRWNALNASAFFVSLLSFCRNPFSRSFRSKTPAIPHIPLNSISRIPGCTAKSKISVQNVDWPLLSARSFSHSTNFDTISPPLSHEGRRHIPLSASEPS